MFSCLYQNPCVESYKYPEHPKFMGAGCVFTDGKHILAGYQPHKAKPGINGIGGHKEENETYQQTAYRETIEELFHVEKVPESLLIMLEKTMVPKKIKVKNDYIMLHFDFQDLELLLRICRKVKLQTPLYTSFPKSLFALIHEREYNIKAEVAALCLLPVVKHRGNKSRDFVVPYFVKDLWDL